MHILPQSAPSYAQVNYIISPPQISV